MHLRHQTCEAAGAADEQGIARRGERPVTIRQHVGGRRVVRREEARGEDLHGSDHIRSPPRFVASLRSPFAAPSERAKLLGTGSLDRSHDRLCDTTTLALLPPKPNALTSTWSIRAGAI